MDISGTRVERFQKELSTLVLLFKNLRTFQNIDYNKLKDDLKYYKSIRTEKVEMYWN